MDTSETYIKMCEKAKEIQEHEFAEGDYHGLLQNGYWSAHNYCEEHGFVGISPEKLIWLPRQDQLQEMIRIAGYSSKHEYDRLLEWWNNRTLNGLLWIEMADWSHEQLWLAFVMKEKYNKVWNGKDWVK